MIISIDPIKNIDRQLKDIFDKMIGVSFLDVFPSESMKSKYLKTCDAEARFKILRKALVSSIEHRIIPSLSQSEVCVVNGYVSWMATNLFTPEQTAELLSYMIYAWPSAIIFVEHLPDPSPKSQLLHAGYLGVLSEFLSYNIPVYALSQIETVEMLKAGISAVIREVVRTRERKNFPGVAFELNHTNLNTIGSTELTRRS